MEQCLAVKLAHGRATKVLIADDYQDLAQHIGSYGQNVLWMMDSNTARLIRPLPQAHLILPPGEAAKNWKSMEDFFKVAVDEGMARDSVFIGFGGGVICDMTAFSASLYMRGCKLTLVPTSLLAMVDAALGGKTAIDFLGGKNLLGTFYPAQEVLICPDILQTLPEREYINGLAEILKHALLSKDDVLMTLFEKNREAILLRDPQIVRRLIIESLQVKASYIEQDPQELKGIRQALNFGHTFGHALESLTHFTAWTHGAAVAWGMCRALAAGVQLGITEKHYAHRVEKLIASYGFNVDYRIGRGDWQSYYTVLAKDKKKLAGEIRFVLLAQQGEPVQEVLSLQLIRDMVTTKPL